MTTGDRRRALLISENAPVPADRRVWNECRTLTEAGWEVVVVCPKGLDRCTSELERREGVEIHRYPLRPAGGGPAGYVREYGLAMWEIRRLVRRLAKTRHFDVVHAANPPDFLLLAARSLRRRGTRFVFDHHDLVPELYRSRFGAGKDLLHRGTHAVERLAFRQADVSIATNESYRRIAIERGGMRPEDVFVVRNGPDLDRFGPVTPDPSLRGDRAHLLAYLGVMGPQDGVDHALRALASLREVRDDWRAVFIGDGDALTSMQALAVELGLDDLVEFAGWRGDEDIRRILSTADVCLAPDPPSPLNDRSTMMKIAEYLAMGRPVASYDLPESRVSAGDAALFAAPGDPQDLARCVDELLSDPELRGRMGRAGRRRAEERLAWHHAAPELIAAYDRALSQTTFDRGTPDPGDRTDRVAGPVRRLIERSATVRAVVKSPPVQHQIMTWRALTVLRGRPRFLALQLAGRRIGQYELRRSALKFHVRHRTGDVAILNKIFAREVTANSYLPPPEVVEAISASGPPKILDVGANIGLFGVFALDYWPGAQVTAFEPDPDNLRVLHRTVAANDLGDRWKVVSRAVSNEAGELSFVPGLRAEAHIAGDRETGTITVPTIDLYEQSGDGVDLIKMDIEGGEWAILSDPRLADLKASAIRLEWHTLLCPEKDAREEGIRLLRAGGFTRIIDGSREHERNGVLWAWREPAGTTRP